MGSFRFYGPVCSSQSTTPLDDGTLIRSCSPLPGTVGGRGPEELEEQRMKAEFEDKQRVLRTLFSMCLAPKEPLTTADWQKAATELGVEPEMIRAIAAIESHDLAPFEGRPAILFERHKFHRHTGGIFSQDHAGLSAPSGGGYGRFSDQYGKLEKAVALDGTAAMMSTSWGMFQIMGEHYQAAGFSSVWKMVSAMSESAQAQLAAFVSLTRSNPKLLKAMQGRPPDWALVAKLYNGAGYAQNHYDTKLKAAYDRLKPAPLPAQRPGAPSLPGQPRPPGPPSLPGQPQPPGPGSRLP